MLIDLAVLNTGTWIKKTARKEIKVTVAELPVVHE